MLNQKKHIRKQAHQFMDACLFALSFWLAYQLRSSDLILDWFAMGPVVPFTEYAWLFLILVPLAPLIMDAQGFYQRPEHCSRWTTSLVLFKACALISLFVVLALFLKHSAPIARGVVVWFGFLSFGVVFLKEEFFRVWRRSLLSQSQFRRHFILVGSGRETLEIRRELQARPDEGIDILAELDFNGGTVEQLIQLIHEHSVNGVILSATHTYFEQVEQAVRACELEGVEAWLVADFFKTSVSRASFDQLYGRPVMVFRVTPQDSWQVVLKPLIDFFGSLLLLLLLSPLLFAVAVLIRATSSGPIFFRQKRSGLNGRPFTILKFRTMVADAEVRKAELQAYNEMSGPVFKMTRDPRVTPLGRFLRKYSLDEFPQLLNVLRGEMSFVGPRPLPVDEVKRFDDHSHRRRLSVKPGLTCLWQISGRNNLTDFKEWVRLDLDYIDRWSLWLDFKIVVQTVPVVLLGTGAK